MSVPSVDVPYFSSCSSLAPLCTTRASPDDEDKVDLSTGASNAATAANTPPRMFSELMFMPSVGKTFAAIIRVQDYWRVY